MEATYIGVICPVFKASSVSIISIDKGLGESMSNFFFDTGVGALIRRFLIGSVCVCVPGTMV